jgi:Bacteriophage tail sheath protein
MPEFVPPGVYVEELEQGPRPIEGVPTSTAGFLGETERGSLRPRLATGFSDYTRWFGGVFADGRYMPHAVGGFFENGGKRLYVCRIVGCGATTASRVFGDFTVTAAGAGAWGRRVWVRIQDGSTKGSFRLRLAYWSRVADDFRQYDPFEAINKDRLPRPQHQEDYDGLSIDPSSPNFFEKRLIDGSTGQHLSALGTIARTAGTDSPPTPTAETGEFLDQGGTDDPAAPGADDFAGDPVGSRLEPSGLLALELDSYRDVAIVHAPHPPDNGPAIIRKVIDHCERQRFRFAVIDGDRDAEPSGLDPRALNGWDTNYAAFYAPWISVSNPESGTGAFVPPGGHVLGIYARTDSERGVFKAPANEIIRGALGVRFQIDDDLQETLNPRGVNAIRRFPDRGILVWGARTLSSEQLWKYVNVRRLFIFLEHSIYDGTQWVVFEPNDERLWARVQDTIRLFLRALWRTGALMGQTEDQAFFITCDRTTMTQDDILNGRLICEIGVAPLRPAEFVIFRIGQWTVEARP